MERSKVMVVAAALLVPVTAAVAVTSVDDATARGTTSSVHAMGHHGSGAVSASSEVGYLSHMVAHHQEAVDAAGELARSERPAMRAFGRRIVATQSAQIRLMQRWLETWYDGASDPSYEPMMRELSGLSGDRLDRTFLQDMVLHHMTAVMTSQHLLVGQDVEHAEVAALARRIRNEQHAEILRMRTWLARWFDPVSGEGRPTHGRGPGHGHAHGHGMSW